MLSSCDAQYPVALSADSSQLLVGDVTLSILKYLIFSLYPGSTEVDFGDGIFWKWTVASESDQPWARGRVWLHHFDGGMWSASWPYVGHGGIFALSSTYVRRDDILALSDFR